ncbi:hypothetical protein RchiOBHm_Chr3g0484191 [Rosa chinensis]|uniref:Uncharacterized protein n=1 Tax=Rosa chinensis TaxID=74649 RepID=A0A2P6REN2_ROSCH|nr:hypothetical protein RchiOBHm_Chr3g0484191 [Rosa chinensis]
MLTKFQNPDRSMEEESIIGKFHCTSECLIVRPLQGRRTELLLDEGTRMHGRLNSTFAGQFSLRSSVLGVEA